MNTLSADLASRTELWIREIWSGNPDAPDTKPEHQGHGAQRALIVSLLQLLAEQGHSANASSTKLLFLVEEPEIYLHPEMCRKMRDALLRLAREGRAQVVCTTHSPIFLDLADRHDGVVILKKSADGKVHIVQRAEDIFGGSSATEQRERLRMILNFDPVANEIFFADRVCLVEGETEIAALNTIAQKLMQAGTIEPAQFATARRKLAIINCRGKWTIPPFQLVLNEFGIHHVVVHDKDGDDEVFADSATKRILAHLNDDESRRLVHDPNFDSEVLSKQIKKDKPWKASEIVRGMPIPLPKPVTRFFEFVLGCSIAELAPKNDSAGVADRRSGIGATPRILLRKDFRDRIPSLELGNVVDVENCSLANALGLPTKSSIEDMSEDAFILKYGDGSRIVLGRVASDVMSDSLLVDDWVALKPLPAVYLERVSGDRALMPLDEFRERVHHDSIHLLAIDDAIERGDCILRRVVLDSLSDGGWFCRLRADNPSVEAWGYLGQVIVHRTQRVKFIGRITGVVRDQQALRDVLKLSSRPT